MVATVPHFLFALSRLASSDFCKVSLRLRFNVLRHCFGISGNAARHAVNGILCACRACCVPNYSVSHYLPQFGLLGNAWFVLFSATFLHRGHAPQRLLDAYWAVNI